MGSGARLKGRRGGPCTEVEKADVGVGITGLDHTGTGRPGKEFSFYFKCEEFPGGFLIGEWHVWAPVLERSPAAVCRRAADKARWLHEDQRGSCAAGLPVSLTHYIFLSTELPQPTLAPLISTPSFLYHFSFSDTSGFLYDSFLLPQFSSVVIVQERDYLNLSVLLCYLGHGLAAGQPGRGPCSCLDCL